MLLARRLLSASPAIARASLLSSSNSGTQSRALSALRRVPSAALAPFSRQLATAATAKKSATKKAAAKKTTAKKPAAKKKPVVKKKAVVKKKIVAKPKPKRVVIKKKVTPEQKTRQELKQLTAELESIPAAPKRPVTPYSAFVGERYPSIAAANTLPADATTADRKLHFQQLSKDIAAAWKSLSDYERDQYRQRYDQAVQEYTEARRAWTSSLTPAQVTAWNRRASLKTRARQSSITKRASKEGAEEGKTGKAYRHGLISKAESHEPKRPGSVFVEFIRSLTPEARVAAGPGGPQRMLAWKAMFAELSEAEREALRVRNTESWARYREEMEAWKASS